MPLGWQVMQESAWMEFIEARVSAKCRDRGLQLLRGEGFLKTQRDSKDVRSTPRQHTHAGKVTSLSCSAAAAELSGWLASCRLPPEGPDPKPKCQLGAGSRGLQAVLPAHIPPQFKP